MDMGVLAISITVLMLGIGIFLMIRDYREARLLRFRVKKMYASPLFEDMLPVLKIARQRHIEQLTLDKTGFVIRYLQPARSETAFLMRHYKHPYLTPERQSALRVVLEECLPKLQDNGRYLLNRRSVRLVNGELEHSYRYTIANAYKSKLMRASDYNGSLKTQLW